MSIMTPRMEAVLDSMTRDEIWRLQEAIDAGNEQTLQSMMYAKDPLIMIEEDPILYNMINGGFSWADLMDAMPQSARRVIEYKEMDPDADWDMPILRLRKHIWESFPVDVVPVQDVNRGDKAERYAIRWNARKYDEARNNCEHGWEYMDYAEDVYRRLLKALNYSRYWSVEEAQEEEDICRIVMNFEEEKPVPIRLPISNVCEEDAAATKPLQRLNDIKARFPVVWKEVEGCKSTTYALEIFGKKVKEQGLNLQRVQADLMTALTASTAWTVLPTADPKQVCLLRMKHANVDTETDTDTDNHSVAESNGNSSDWETVPVKKAAATAAAAAATKPLQPLQRLNDLKERFPIVWKEVEGCKSTTYAVEIHGKKVKEQGLNLQRVKADLTKAMNASAAWTVLPATDPKQVCLLRMNHA